MHDTGCLGLVQWDDPEGWYGEGGGRRVQDEEHIHSYNCTNPALVLRHNCAVQPRGVTPVQMNLPHREQLLFRESVNHM